MNFVETRGNDGSRPSSVTFSQAILSPMCSFGGIYVPESLPELGEPFLRAHLDSDYKALARAVLDAFELDVEPAGLAVGDTLHVDALKLPAGVSLTSTKDLTLVTIIPPTVEAEAPAAEVEGEAAKA